jgi:hypothetical protein
MQYLEGETLVDRLTKGALPSDQVLKIAIEVADALEGSPRRNYSAKSQGQEHHADQGGREAARLRIGEN